LIPQFREYSGVGSVCGITGSPKEARWVPFWALRNLSKFACSVLRSEQYRQENTLLGEREATSLSTIKELLRDMPAQKSLRDHPLSRVC
jgi:hypothetical protein